MRKISILYYFLLALMTSCTSEHKEIELFSKELGPEKMEALNGLIASYDQFLSLKYPAIPSLAGKSTQFLLDVYQNKAMSFKEVPGIDAVLQRMEDSGLRKDIYIHESERESYPGYPVDQLIPIKYPEESMGISQIDTPSPILLASFQGTLDKNEKFNKNSKLKFNKNGLFMYALAKSKQNDESYMNYIEAKYKIGDIHPSLLAMKHLKQLSEETPTWFQKLPFIIDIYYKMLLTQDREDDNLLSYTF